MENYKAVKQWAATVNIDEAINELVNIKQKYPWLKIPKIEQTLMQLSTDMPKIVNIITHQEKQNAIHREYIRVNGLADTTIAEAIKAKFNL